MSGEQKHDELSTTDKDVEEGIQLSAPLDSGKNMPIVSSPAPANRADSKMMNGKSVSKVSSLRFEGKTESTVIWRNLNKHVDAHDGSKKQILFDINGSAKPGEMIALMGPSGSGKTTLLNVLGGRALAHLQGDVLINNQKYRKSMRRTIAYVLQEDLFYMQLTVRQQLFFTACLRMPDSKSAEEKHDAVNLVIDTLRIQRCADTQIMLISGGEKKRTNIGTELLTNPSILLLDEPTSGLDATAANSLVVTMRELASEGMTVITSIHQPSSKVFYSFDKLILLADGHMVYTGPPGKCLQYLATKNYVPPADYNPADFVMDLVNDTESEEGGKAARAVLIEAWDNTAVLEEIRSVESICDQHQTDKNSDSEDDAMIKQYPASYFTQFWTLLQRSLIVSKTALVTSWQLIQCVTFAVISGLAYFRMPYNEDRINDRAGYIFLFLTFWFFMTLFQGMMQFIPERGILQKERSAGSFRLSAYFLAKVTAETPIKLFLPFLFLAISYPMANLNPNPGAFFAIVGIQLLAALAGESVGLFIGTVTVDMEKAMVLATLMSLLLMLAGGYFVQNLPSFAEWVRYVSPFKYSYDACVQIEFDRDIDCNNGEYLQACNGRDKVDGQEAIDLLDVTESVWLNCVLLIVYMTGFRFLAYLCLRFLPHNSGRV